MTSIQRRLNVDATSWRCIDVEATLYRRHVSAGIALYTYTDLSATSAFVIRFCTESRGIEME